METKFQTSFIPKTTLEPAHTNVKKPLGLFAFLATIIFFISAVVAGGAFGWHKFLEKKKADMNHTLEENIKKFEPDSIKAYVRLDNRINSAKEILANHVAVSYIFDFLQDMTLQSTGFTDFKYSIGTDGSATLAMNGIAKSYNAVAYQATVFGSERALRGPIFSNLDVDNVGNIVFNFSTNVDPGFIAYTRKARTEPVTDVEDNANAFGQPVLQIPPVDNDTESQSSVPAGSSLLEPTKPITPPK